MVQINRRKAFITIGGGAALVLSAGGLWTVSRAPAKALEPWRAAVSGKFDDPRLGILAHAILAPNPMNRQPWQIRLDGADGATLFCDLERRLFATDPFDRQTVIGFGAFIELARIAAAEAGYRLEVAPFPEGPALPVLDQRPIARLKFVADKSVEKDRLFGAIERRRTNRTVFDTDAQLDTATIDALRAQSSDAAIVDATASRDRVSALRTICADGIIQEAATDSCWAQQTALTRIGKTEVEANPDGITITGAFPEAAQTFGVLSRKMLTQKNSTAARQAVEMLTNCAATAMAFAWVTTPDNSRESQLAAGAAYARMDLEAAARAIAIHPLSQALQEIPELAGPRTALAGELKLEDSKIQMLARLGKAKAPAPAPRWPIEAKLIRT